MFARFAMVDQHDGLVQQYLQRRYRLLHLSDTSPFLEAF